MRVEVEARKNKHFFIYFFLFYSNKIEILLSLDGDGKKTFK